MTKTALGKLYELGFQHLIYEQCRGSWIQPMEHWHPDVSIAFGQLLSRVATPFRSGSNMPDIPYHQAQGSTSEWLGFRRANVPRNPLSSLRNMIDGGKKMAYEEMERASTAMPGQLMKPRTFREQIQDQIAHHKARITDLEGVLESMTPEVEKFVEALQKANL